MSNSQANIRCHPRLFIISKKRKGKSYKRLRSLEKTWTRIDASPLSTISPKNFKISNRYVPFHLMTETSQVFSTWEFIGIVQMKFTYNPLKLDDRFIDMCNGWDELRKFISWLLDTVVVLLWVGIARVLIEHVLMHHHYQPCLPKISKFQTHMWHSI